MSYIDKLSILGVRSFDNRVSETIQFYSPLTLIVGFNGSGKTTIIECLKYATTGELPPNSDRGRSFIHDPNLCGEREVLAQVRMSFKSTSGVKMVATRNLQLTVKKSAKSTTRTVKALEGQLLMVKDAERTAISSRVAELNQILPQYLGVAPAILEYVIFCHQEDSMWPMSEPAMLKKRFDEIFEALKYTKAVDNIKILQKRQREELAKLKIIEQHAKDDKDKGERTEQRSTVLYAEVEELREKAKDLDMRVKEAAERAREAWDHAAKFQSIVAKLDGKRIEAAATERNVEELRQNIKEMTDTDDELQAHLDQFEERVQLYQRDREEKVKRYNQATQTIEHNRRALGTKQSEVGKYEAEKDQYEKQLRVRERLIKETANRHNIRGFDLEITDDQVQDFMERIGKLVKDQQTALERARRQKQEGLQNANKELQQLKDHRSSLESSRSNYKNQIASNDHKIARLHQQLEKIDIDEGSKALLKSNLEDIKKRLDNAKEEHANAKIDDKIRELNSQMRELDDQKEKLDGEMLEATRRAGDSAQLDWVRNALKEKQNSIATRTAAQKDQLSGILRLSWEPRTLESDFNSALGRKSDALRDAELQRDGTNRELEQIRFKLTTAKNDLKRKLDELKASERHVSEVLDEDSEPKEFPDMLEQAEKTVDLAKSDAANFGSMRDFFHGCIETLEKHNVCQLCRRAFKPNDSKKTEFQRRLEARIQDAVKEISQEALDEYVADLARLRDAQPHYEKWLRLKQTEIPELEATCHDLESKRDALLGTIEGQDQTVNERQESKRDVELMMKTVQSIVQDYKDISKFEEQIKELSAKQHQVGAFRGAVQIQDDLKQNTEQTKHVRNTLAQLTSDKDRARDAITRLEFEFRDVGSKLNNAEYSLKEKSSLQSQVQELRSQNSEHRDSMRQTDQDLQNLIPQVEQAEAKYKAVEQRGIQKEQELQAAYEKVSESLRDLKNANRDIVAYLDNGGADQLDGARREIEDLQNEIEQTVAVQRQITSEIKKIEEQLRNHTDTKRAINDNIRYRAGLRTLEEVKAEIAELEAHNAEVDKDRYEREATRWQNERNKLSAEQASIIGTMKSKDDILQQLLQDWETDYKHAAFKYKEAHIKVEATKAAVEDLGRYGGALDKAIVKYHGLKLEEINRIIEELWKKTYQGTDVDTILIKSDTETTNKARSYNYRVVMVKQDAEMDMRGRCSAGQKVLASIIIRLALAECFGVNCGLIALDEPTTNLDRDNIRALAESLAEIIRVRRQQSNFQLIVITHDEEFLRYMQCADFCDYYYRVSRNEKQKSQIEKQSIAEVL